MLNRETILHALQRLSDVLGERNVRGEICLLGGTAMVLAFRARPNTKDVGAIFYPPAGDLPQFSNLRVVAPTVEYMLAMKCMGRAPGSW